MTMENMNDDAKVPGFALVMADAETKYQQTQKELSEITLLIHQSADEVEKLAQRNAQINNKLRLMENSIDSMPREDIQEIYHSAQDAQSRLFMMRGQVEQLQGKQQYLERYATHLKEIIDSYHLKDRTLSQKTSGGEATPQATSSIMNIINAQEQERLHLSRQLHDGPAQSLTNLILQAEICERLFDKDPPRARTELGVLKEAVNDTFQKIREYIFQLRPMMLDDLGLAPTLKQYVQEFESKHAISCNLMITGTERRFPPYVEVTLFRVIQALLNNIADHSKATQSQVSMEIQSDRITATITDDGVGFDVETELTNASQQKHMGLISMKEQISMLNGEINVESVVGQGTTVSLWLPIE